MNKSQYKWGKEKIEKYAKKHKLTYSQAIYVFEDIATINDMYDWVNMSEFLHIEIDNLLETLEE